MSCICAKPGRDNLKPYLVYNPEDDTTTAGKASIDDLNANSISLLDKKETTVEQEEGAIKIRESMSEYTIVISLLGYLEAYVNMTKSYRVGAMKLCAGDLDGDGNVEVDDFRTLTLKLHSLVEPGSLGDLESEAVNASDFDSLLRRKHKTFFKEV